MIGRVAVTNETSVAELVDYWLTQLRAEGRLEATTINEYERVAQQARRSRSDLGDIVDLMFATDARIGEVLALRWSDLRSGDVPSMGCRAIASCRNANANMRLSSVRECLARDWDNAAWDFRNHSTRPVVISPSV